MTSIVDRVVQHIYDLEPASMFTIRDLALELGIQQCNVRPGVYKCAAGLSVDVIVNTKHYMVLDNIKDVIDNGIIPEKEYVNKKSDFRDLIIKLEQQLSILKQAEEINELWQSK